MKRSREKESGTLRTRMAQATDLPKDVVLGVPVITITGSLEVSVENYRGILDYTKEQIRILCRKGEVRILGRDLEIASYTNTDMKITGYIRKLEFTHP